MSFWPFCCKSPQVYTFGRDPGASRQFCNSPPSGSTYPEVRGRYRRTGTYGVVADATTGRTRHGTEHVDNQIRWKSLSWGAGVCEDGTLWKFGSFFGGEYVAGDRPTQVGNDADWDEVSCGTDGVVLCKKTNGTLWSFGSNDHGGLGIGLDCYDDSGTNGYAYRAKISSKIEQVVPLEPLAKFSRKPQVAVRCYVYGKQGGPTDDDYVSGGSPSAAATIECDWTGAVHEIGVTSGGSGYKSRPTVTLTSSNGKPEEEGAGASAVVTKMTPVSVVGFEVVSPGSGYTSAVATDATTGATATAAIGPGGEITAWILTDPGDGDIDVLDLPTFDVSVDGDGAGAYARVSLSGSSVEEIKMDFNPECWTEIPLVEISGGGGSGANAAVDKIVGTAADKIRIVDGGAGYTQGQKLLSGLLTERLYIAAQRATGDDEGEDDEDDWVRIDEVILSRSHVTSVARIDEHLLTEDQKDDNDKGLLYGFFHRRQSSGEVPPFKFRMSESQFFGTCAGHVYNPGTSARAKRIEMFLVGPAGSSEVQLTKTRVFTGIIRILVKKQGSGYLAPPAVTIAGGGGSGATAVAVLDGFGRVSRIDIVSHGSGYEWPPKVTIAASPDGGFFSAEATAFLRDEWEFSLNSTLTGYASPPFLLAKATDPIGSAIDLGLDLSNIVGLVARNTVTSTPQQGEGESYAIALLYTSAGRFSGTSITAVEPTSGASATYDIINGILRFRSHSPIPVGNGLPEYTEAAQISVPASDDFTFAAYVAKATFHPLTYEYPDNEYGTGQFLPPPPDMCWSLNPEFVAKTFRQWRQHDQDISNFGLGDEPFGGRAAYDQVATCVPWFGPSIAQQTRFFFPTPDQDSEDESKAAYATADNPQEYGIDGYVGVGEIVVAEQGSGYREEPIADVESNHFRNPVQIAGSWTSFSAGPAHCGVDSSGSLLWWGRYSANSRHLRTVMRTDGSIDFYSVYPAPEGDNHCASPVPIGGCAVIEDFYVGDNPAHPSAVGDIAYIGQDFVHAVEGYVSPPNFGTHISLFIRASHSDRYGPESFGPDTFSQMRSNGVPHYHDFYTSHKEISAYCLPGIGYTSPPTFTFMGVGSPVYSPPVRCTQPLSFTKVTEGIAKSATGVWFDATRPRPVIPFRQRRTSMSSVTKTYYTSGGAFIKQSVIVTIGQSINAERYTVCMTSGGSNYSSPPQPKVVVSNRTSPESVGSYNTSTDPNAHVTTTTSSVSWQFSQPETLPDFDVAGCRILPDSSVGPLTWSASCDIFSGSVPMASISGNGSGATVAVDLRWGGLAKSDSDPLPLTPAFVGSHEFATARGLAVPSAGAFPVHSSPAMYGLAYSLPQCGAAESAAGGLILRTDGTIVDFSRAIRDNRYLVDDLRCLEHIGPISIAVEEHGSGYDNPAIVEIDQPDGVAKFDVTYDGKLVGIGVVDGGSGYGVPPNILGEAAGATCKIAGPLASVEVATGGSDYRYPPDISFSQPGISAKATAKIKNGGVVSISIDDGGRYRAAPTVTITPVNDIEEIVVSNAGSDFTSTPSVFIGGGGGEGGAATCRIWGGVKKIVLLSGGSGYEQPPEVVFIGGGGTGAAAVAVIANGSVVSVSVTSPGDFYESEPSVKFVGGGGSGAVAGAVLNGRIRDVTVVNRGHHYSVPPKVLFVGGGGGFAEATAVLGAPGSGASAIAKLNGSLLYVDVAESQNKHDFPPDVDIDRVGEPTVDDPVDAVAKARVVGKVTEIAPVASPSTGKYTRLQPWRTTPSFFGDKIPAKVSLVGSAVEDYDLIHDAGTSKIVPTGQNESEVAPRGGAPISVDLLSSLQDKEFYHKPSAIAHDSYAVAADTCLTLSGYALEGMSDDTNPSEVHRPDNELTPASLTLFSISRAVPVFAQSTPAEPSLDYPFSRTPDIISPTGAISRFVAADSLAASNDLLQRKKVYSTPPTLDIEDEIDGGASLAALQQEIPSRLEGENNNDYVERFIDLTLPGDSHTLRARIVIHGGTPLVWGAPATATAVLDAEGRVVSIQPSGQGGYSRPPTVVIVGGGGEGAVAGVPVLSDDGAIESISVLSGGSGYSEPPKVYIIDDERESHRDPDVISLFAWIGEWVSPFLKDWKIEYVAVVHKTQRSMSRILPQRVGESYFSQMNRQILSDPGADAWAFDTHWGSRNPGQYSPRYRIHPVYDDSGYVENVYIARYSQSKAYPPLPLPAPSVEIKPSGRDPVDAAQASAVAVKWSGVYGSRYGENWDWYYNDPLSYAYGAIMPESDAKEI